MAKQNDFLVDGEAVDFLQLVNLAAKLNGDFKDSAVQRTSDAARILRAHGYSVERRAPLAQEEK